MYICVTVLPPHWARLEKNDAYRLAPAALALHDGYKLALGAVEHQLDMAFGLFVVDDRASRSPEFKIMAATEPLPCDNILTRGGITGITASISTGIRTTTPFGSCRPSPFLRNSLRLSQDCRARSSADCALYFQL